MTFSGTSTAASGAVCDGAAFGAADFSALRSRLSAFLADGGCALLSDAERVDAIRAAEELACTLSAAQAALAASLDASVQAERAARGVAPERRGRGVAEQVAHARRESPHRGRRHLGLARVAPAELPYAWAAWCAGRVSEWTVTLLAQETACLPLEHRLAVDELVAGDADAFEAMSPYEVRGRCRAEAERLDPASVLARRRYAEGERHVSIRPAPDTMTWVTALLPVKEGVAVYATLTRAADAARSAGDPRTRGQVMADALVQGVLAAPSEPSSSDASRPGVQLHLLMTDTALFGGADEGARLDGYGPIPAELAREIVCDTLASDESVWVRRLLTDPVTGSLVAYDSRARRFPATLERLIRLRDGVCRTPWCSAPVRHIDHAEPYATGGATSFANGQGLCEGCNYAKQADDWQTRVGPDGEVATTMPTGHRYRTRPPDLATIRYGAPPLTIEYVLSG
ncbi:MAG: DUF222 domain-containing protein [Nocardioides sp.]|uniref:HNH endonuclease n=1 Tax=Nocardioides sp. TaxID=35761 RepID=UPI003F0A8BC2